LCTRNREQRKTVGGAIRKMSPMKGKKVGGTRRIKSHEITKGAGAERKKKCKNKKAKGGTH